MIKLRTILCQIKKIPIINHYRLSQKNHKFKIVDDPKDVSKLVFQEDGRCLLFEHKNGLAQLKWIVRVSTLITTVNTLLTGAQYAYPVFGAWNHFSFGICTTIGFFGLTFLQVISKRTVHQIYLHDNLQYVDINFFNAFWVSKVVTFHISQFQQPTPSIANFLRFELTSIGKIWIKLEKNQFRNVKDYEQTLDSVLLGKPLTNITIAKKKKNI